MGFNNRVAVITGGAGNIGKCLAHALCAQGVRVAVTDLQEEAAQAAAAEMPNNLAKGYAMDVTSTESVNTAARRILDDFGKVDILFNNAGVWKQCDFADMDEAMWTNILDINLHSVFKVTKAFLPQMIANHYGRIVNLASISGEVGLPHYSAYSTAKAGVIILTKTMAMELAKKGITVNAVSPGMIWKERKETTLNWQEHTGIAEDVVHALMFLADDNAGYTTGVDFPVDGGRVLGPHGNLS